MRRVLIDECINPRLAARLRESLPGDIVETVRDRGLAGKPDHTLIREISNRFDVFLTIDKGFEFEHNIEQLSFFDHHPGSGEQPDAILRETAG